MIVRRFMMQRITLVSLGVFVMVLLSVSLLNAADPPPSDSYQTTGLDGNLPVFYKQLQAKLTFPLSWNSGSFKDFDKWRRTAREKVLECMIQPVEETPFGPKIIDEQDRGSYLARKVVFNVTAESRVLGLMLLPKGKGPFPAVLLLHDHGSKFDIGKEKMIEPWGNEARLTSARAWAERYFSGRFVGDELAKRGYAVLAVDALGWGDRGGLTYEAQQALQSNLLNTGTSMAGLMACEDMRAAEFLATLPEIDKKRIGALGFSMGAFRAWQVAALSEHISAAVAVCWMTTSKGIMVPGNNQLRGQSANWMTHPGLVRYLDYPDVASIAAPKPMLFYNGEIDNLFPAASVKDAYAQMQKVWLSQKAADRLEIKPWPGLGHLFLKEQQEPAFAWLDRWLKEKK
jgi:dienelactone hydrolase